MALGCGEPGIAGECSGDGVEGGDAVIRGGVEVAADAAPAGEGPLGVPVSGDGLVPLGGFDGLLGAVVRPVHGELSGEQPDLLFVVAQPAAEGVAGVVAVVPVPVPVVRDPEGDGLVVAPVQLRQKLRIEGGIAPGQRLLDRLVRLAEDLDDVAGPGLQAAGTEPGDRAAPADDVLVMPISA
jgi:hypothetical protein